VAGVVSLSGASGFGGVEAEAASSPATPDADRLRTEQRCIRAERTAGDATPDVLEGAPDADRDVQGRDGDGLRGRRLVAQGRRDQAVEVFMTEAIGMPAEYLEPMKADRSWEKMTRYAHTLAYDGHIVQGTQDGASLSPGRWSVTQPTEVVAGEGSEAFFDDGARALVELLPRASYRVLPGQDHSAFWMAPDAVAASVAGFLQATAR
jgi:pimeloyl-ACP methyl ester carboxylesterase